MVKRTGVGQFLACVEARAAVAAPLGIYQEPRTSRLLDYI